MRDDFDEVTDERLGPVIAELRRPVRLDPALDQRVLARAAGRAEPRSVARRGARCRGPADSWEPRSPRGCCSPCSDATRGATRPIELRLSAPASQVMVVGDFNDWDPAATPLRPGNEGGTWTVELRLPPGRYRYTFLVDGRRWVPDPVEPRAADDDFGAPTSVLTVS